MLVQTTTGETVSLVESRKGKLIDRTGGVWFRYPEADTEDSAGFKCNKSVMRLHRKQLVRICKGNANIQALMTVEEIKEYIEDLDDIGELHIPNLITQITNNYKEQISYFEYLGFNNYGPNVQHLYKLEDNEIPIHTPPEFLNVRNVIGSDGSLTPNINVYVSEI